MIYLDNAATTKPRPEVIESMMPYLTEKWHNPSSLYNSALKIKEDIEAVRKAAGRFIGANSDEIYFTSSGSESNCWAISGFCHYWNLLKIRPVIITSTIEHKSILECVKNMIADVYYVDVDDNGLIKLDVLSDILNDISLLNLPLLCSFQLANNEIGTIQDIKKISNMIKCFGGLLHADCVQAFGQIPIDVDEMGIDMLSASGHKIGCPKGIGFLYIRNGTTISPMIYGSQMNSMRGGTENVPYIVGFGKSLELCDTSSEKVKEICDKRDFFIEQLETKFGCKLNGHPTYRLPNNVNVTFPQNITGESLLYMLDMSNINISTGSACNSKSIEPSYVLKAVGLSNTDAMRTIRITLSDNILYKDILDTIEEISTAVKLIES